MGFRRGFSWPRCTNGWADGMAVGRHSMETRLSEMWGKLQKYPHRFEAVLSVRGIMGISRVGISQEVGVFARIVILQ